MGVWKCIYKHIPLDELNTTLEIVFSTQIYLTISVASVWCVFLQLTYRQASNQTSPRIPRRMSHGRQEGKMFIATLCLSFCTSRQVVCWTQADVYVFTNAASSVTLTWVLAAESETSSQPKYHWAGELCVTSDLPLQFTLSLPHSDMQTQTDHLTQIHSCLSSVHKVFWISGICLLLTDLEKVGLLPTSFSMFFVDQDEDE